MADSLFASRTYLEMLAPEALRPAVSDDPALRFEQVHACPVEFYRFLYAEVGRRYHWTDRLGWTDDEIHRHVSDPAITLWVLYQAGSPAGYFELRVHDDGSVEVAYFGLLPSFVGRGLGKHLLTLAVRQAWALGALRVWLHTSTLDHPAAMPNYLKRGFTPYREERYAVTPRSP